MHHLGCLDGSVCCLPLPSSLVSAIFIFPSSFLILSTWHPSQETLTCHLGCCCGSAHCFSSTLMVHLTHVTDFHGPALLHFWWQCSVCLSRWSMWSPSFCHQTCSFLCWQPVECYLIPPLCCHPLITLSHSPPAAFVESQWGELCLDASGTSTHIAGLLSEWPVLLPPGGWLLVLTVCRQSILTWHLQDGQLEKRKVGQGRSGEPIVCWVLAMVWLSACRYQGEWLCCLSICCYCILTCCH